MLEEVDPEVKKYIHHVIAQQTNALKTKDLKVVLRDLKKQLEYSKNVMVPMAVPYKQ